MSFLLETKSLFRTFRVGKYNIPVIRGLNLKILKGKTIGIVGESGCGKTTLGRLISGLDQNYTGEINFNGYSLKKQLNKKIFRSKIQMVFQYPALSLNPKMKIYKILKEPLKLILK